MFAGEFNLRYHVIQNDDGSANRIIFWDLPRELFDVVPVKEHQRVSEPGTEQSFYKIMNKSGVEWWFKTREDQNGNIEGILPPIEMPSLPSGGE
jgi:hypothetical protein